MHPDPSGIADLNGFFIDVGNDGGDVSRLGRGNNMKGSDNDGDKLDKFDYAKKLGTVGGNDADNTAGTVTISMADLGISDLSELDGAEIGIRATSVGPNREDSLKLADVGEYCPPDDPSGRDDFPLWPNDISHVTLVFKDTIDDGVGDTNGDGYYTVKIDNWPNLAGDDLDDSIDEIMDWLIANDSFVLDDSNLCGVVIKGGQAGSDFYAYGDENLNGTDPDPLPPGIGFDLTGGQGNENPANAIDHSVDWDVIF